MGWAGSWTRALPWDDKKYRDKQLVDDYKISSSERGFPCRATGSKQIKIWLRESARICDNLREFARCENLRESARMVFAVVSSTINVFFTWLRESARTFFRACHQKCGWARICENCENIYLFMTLSSTIHVLNIRARICENVGESARICENCFIGPGPWGPCSGPWKPPGPLSRTLESSSDLLMRLLHLDPFHVCSHMFCNSPHAPSATLLIFFSE